MERSEDDLTSRSFHPPGIPMAAPSLPMTRTPAALLAQLRVR